MLNNNKLFKQFKLSLIKNGGDPMKRVFLTVLLVLSISFLSSIAYANDNAPPPIPVLVYGDVTYEGGPVPDGYSIEADVSGQNHAQATTTSGGQYAAILVDGDRPLTFNDDRDCSVHWAAGEACVPCNDESDCIEGPVDGDDVLFSVNNNDAMPYFDWEQKGILNVDLVLPIGDWDSLGCVDMVDFTYFADHYGQICTPMVNEVCDFYDVYRDYVIDMVDFTVFADHYGEGC